MDLLIIPTILFSSYINNPFLSVCFLNYIKGPILIFCPFSSYYDQMCGLCGDYDGTPDNDFTKPDGTLVGNVNDFCNSWQTDEDEDDK